MTNKCIIQNDKIIVNGASNQYSLFLPSTVKILNGKEIESMLPSQIPPKTIFLVDCSQLSTQERNLLEQFCEKCVDGILFDSDVHNWSPFNSQFKTLINDKSNLSIVIEDTDGNIFGYYVSSKINGFPYLEKPRKYRKDSGKDTFHFILKTTHPSFSPMKFEMTN